MAWWEDAHFPARARRAALPRPGRPKNHLQENLRILPPLSHFGGSIAQKRRAVKKNRGPGGAGMQTGGGLPPGCARLPGRPHGRPAGRPYTQWERSKFTPQGRIQQKVPRRGTTPPYKPPQTAYRIADVPAGRRGGMYAARKAFLRQRGFACRQPVFGCTVGRGLDPAAQCFRCPEGSGPWKRPRAACRPPLHPMADPKITHNVPPSTPPPQSPSFFFREIVLYWTPYISPLGIEKGSEFFPCRR